jgi:excisionase family DNA binding protein
VNRLREHTKNGAASVATADCPDLSRAGSSAPPATWLVPLLIDTDQAGVILGVSSRTIKRMVAEGTIPGVTRVGRCLRFRRLELEAWIAKGCPKGRWIKGR